MISEERTLTTSSGGFEGNGIVTVPRVGASRKLHRVATKSIKKESVWWKGGDRQGPKRKRDKTELVMERSLQNRYTFIEEDDKRKGTKAPSTTTSRWTGE